MALHHFIHVGDTHLQPGPRQADRLSALDQILDHARTRAEEDTLAAIIWPGDLYHVRSTIEDRNALIPRVQAFAQMAPVLICPGNHDQPGDLDVLGKLEAPYLVLVVPTPRVVRFDSASGAIVSAFVLPYPHKAGLVAAGVEHQALGQDAAALFDPIFISAADELRCPDRALHIPLMATHINIGGALSSVGQPQIGREIELNQALLARLPDDVAVMGNHIHKHQQVGRLVYAGSIARMDYGEQEAKGFVEWTFDDQARTWSWQFLELTTPRQIHVDGRLTRERFQILRVDGVSVCEHCGGDGWYAGTGSAHADDCDGTCRNCPVPVPTQEQCPCGGAVDVGGADVRCRYWYVKAEVGAIDVAKIHAEFAGCRSLKLDPIAELEHSIRAPEIAAAETLEEKAQHCARIQGIPVTPGFFSKVTALQAQDSETVLAQVQAFTAQAGRPRVLQSEDVEVPA